MKDTDLQYDASMGLRWLDIHCHCLWDLDDGPSSLDESIELCEALVSDGVGVVIATPHQLGKYEGFVSSSLIKRKVEELKSCLQRRGIPLEVYPGADIRLDERILELLQNGSIVSLAESRYVLIEIPHEVFVDPLPMIEMLRRNGYFPIISHPERHKRVLSDPGVVDSWLRKGALLQVTAGSLAGQFGEEVRKLAFSLVVQGKASFIASDSHNVKDRAPAFTECALQIAGSVGADALLSLFERNPRHVIENTRLQTPYLTQTGQSKARKPGSS